MKKRGREVLFVGQGGRAMPSLEFAAEVATAVSATVLGYEWIERAQRPSRRALLLLWASVFGRSLPLTDWLAVAVPVLALPLLGAAALVAVVVAVHAALGPEPGAASGVAAGLLLLAWAVPAVPRELLVLVAFWLVCWLQRTALCPVREAAWDLGVSLLWTALFFAPVMCCIAAALLVVASVGDALGVSHETLSPLIYYAVLYGPNAQTYWLFRRRQRRRVVLPK